MTDIVFVPLMRGHRRTSAALLRHGGFRVEVFGSLQRALHAVRARPPAAVVAAVDAAESCRAVATLRLGTDAPIVVISPKASEDEKVRALDAGADDYITQPYGAEELLARLRAHLRRSAERDGSSPVVTPDFNIDVAARRLRRTDGEEVSLTALEWRVLEVLLRRPGHLVGREQLLQEVRGAKGLEEPHYLRVYLSRLRQKLEPDPHAPRYLVTVFGVGVYLCVDGSPAVGAVEAGEAVMMGA